MRSHNSPMGLLSYYWKPVSKHTTVVPKWCLTWCCKGFPCHPSTTLHWKAKPMRLFDFWPGCGLLIFFQPSALMGSALLWEGTCVLHRSRLNKDLMTDQVKWKGLCVRLRVAHRANIGNPSWAHGGGGEDGMWTGGTVWVWLGWLLLTDVAAGIE